ncbi:hypothetical protein BH18ACI4_BH18ACI4_10320 [soil metagenome]
MRLGFGLGCIDNSVTGSTNDDPRAKLDLTMRTPGSTRTIQFILVPILSLWIAGAGCMIGCEGMVSAAAAVAISGLEMHSRHQSERKAPLVASGSACSSSGSHSCCANNAGETKPEAERTGQSVTTLSTVGGSSSGMTKACPLAVGKAAIAASVRNRKVASAALLAHSSLTDENIRERTSPLSAPVRLPNRGHTYLHFCVFLI